MASEYVFFEINKASGDYIASKKGTNAKERQPIWYDPKTRKCSDVSAQNVACPDIIRNYTQNAKPFVIATAVLAAVVLILIILYLNK